MTDETENSAEGGDFPIESDRFVIRPLTADDISQRYIDWLNDPEINRFLEVRWRSQDLDSVRSYVASHDRKNNYILGIFEKAEDKHIGNFSLRVDPNNRKASMGVMIGDKEYWGQAVVLEARARVLDSIFDKMPVDKVSGGCYQTNTHAIFNYRRQGWQVDGIRKADRVDGDRRVDLVHFTMFKERWLDCAKR